MLSAVPVFKLLEKYRPEDKAAKKDRLKAAAEAKVAAPAAGDDSKRPKVLKFGLNHITHLVETGKAAYVVIASDVDPIEVCARDLATPWVLESIVLYGFFTVVPVLLCARAVGRVAARAVP